MKFEIAQHIWTQTSSRYCCVVVQNMQKFRSDSSFRLEYLCPIRSVSVLQLQAVVDFPQQLWLQLQLVQLQVSPHLQDVGSLGKRAAVKQHKHSKRVVQRPSVGRMLWLLFLAITILL